MTTTASIKAQIAAVEADMAQAQTLADQLAAMQAAAQRVADCRRDLAHLAGRLAEAETADRMHAGALTKYTVSNIRTEAESPTPASVHRVSFVERVTRFMNEAPQEVARTVRLDSIPADLRRVIAEQPHLIPAYILALDADPFEALCKHATHAGRGYWIAPKDWTERMQMPEPPTFIAPGIEQL